MSFVPLESTFPALGFITLSPLCHADRPGKVIGLTLAGFINLVSHNDITIIVCGHFFAPGQSRDFPSGNAVGYPCLPGCFLLCICQLDPDRVLEVSSWVLGIEVAFLLKLGLGPLFVGFLV